MLYVSYDECVKKMTEGLLPYMPEETAERFAKVFADNSADGIASHGMNRYPRYVGDIRDGRCDPTVTEPERIGGFGAMEVWDAHGGIGPLCADFVTERAISLAREHGVACIGLRNNSHWLRAGRYGLAMANAGMVGICFTNTNLNLAAYGTKVNATGNNPLTMALPRREGALLLDMAMSQYAYGKLEVMAQTGKMLPEACGYDSEGNLTNDPAKIANGGLLLPLAQWKGSALSVMLDMTAAMLSRGRTSREIGLPKDGEECMSQVFICMHPAALGEMEAAYDKIEATLEFLHSLPSAEGMSGVRAPGENLASTREKNMKDGIPVTEATWNRILAAASCEA